MKGQSIIGMLIAKLGNYLTDIKRLPTGKGATWTININNPIGFPIRMNRDDLVDVLLEAYVMVCKLKGEEIGSDELAEMMAIIEKGVDFGDEDSKPRKKSGKNNSPKKRTKKVSKLPKDLKTQSDIRKESQETVKGETDKSDEDTIDNPTNVSV